jgi:PTS system sucrose-specific IIC component
LSGGAANIAEAASCMTRLRLNVRNKEKVNFEAIKTTPGVQGVVYASGQVQIILGTGAASKTCEAFKTLLPAGTLPSGQELRAQISKKNETPFKLLLKKIANIFIPLIPAFIGCGLILAANNILVKFVPAWAASPWAQIFAVMGGAVTFGLNIFTGVNAAKEFGGSPMIGGVMAIILTNSALSGVTIGAHVFVPGRGGVIAVILVVALACWLERKIRARMPDILDLFLTPFFVILITGLAALFVLQPVGGWIADAIASGVNTAISKSGLLSGFALACGFLPLVMTGLHQGLAPIHAQLVAQYGFTALFPVLAMAGAGQVGAAFYVLLKTKNERLKKITISALPVGILGVGEPLIFGVTLPLGKPFFAACAGAGFGGALSAYFGIGSYTIGGISGVPLAPLTTLPLAYLGCLLVSYAAGFIFAWLIGFDDPAI